MNTQLNKFLIFETDFKHCLLIVRISYHTLIFAKYSNNSPLGVVGRGGEVQGIVLECTRNIMQVPRSSMADRKMCAEKKK